MESFEGLVSSIQEESVIESVSRAKELYLDTKKINRHIFNSLLKLDPTVKYEGDKPIGGKYIEWMIRVFIRDHMSPSDINKFGVMKDFDKLINKNLIQQKDINQYKSVESVYDEVKKYEDVKTKSEQEKEEKKDADVIFENDRVLVVMPRSKESSCRYGANTKWCTSGTTYNYFNSYYYGKGVSLYYVIPKGEYLNKYGKIAVAVNPNGDRTYYNAQDNSLSEQTVKPIFHDLGIK